MKLILLISTLLILPLLFNNLKCQGWEYNLSEEKLKGHQIVDVVNYNNLLFAFTINNKDTTFYFENIDDKNLNSIRIDEFGKPSIYLASETKLKSDNDGNIWFSMDKLWKYSNGNIETFDIFKDLDTNWRKIIDFEFDNKGNIWIAVGYDVLLYQNGSDKIVKGYAELFKYNSNGLERVRFDSIASDENYEFGGYQYMDRANDGTIFLSIKRKNDNLMIIENEEITYRTLEGISESPGRNVTDFHIINKNEFYVTYKDFHYLSGSQSIKFGGISYYNHGTWRHYNGSDGLPIHDYAIPPGNLDSPADVFSVCQDKEGNYYFATVGAILKIKNDEEIIVFDGKEIVKNSIMYGVNYFINSFKEYEEPIFTRVAKVNNKLYATVMYGVIEIDESTLSVNNDSHKQLKVFPNPIVNDYANVELPENEIINSISIIDLSGVKIDTEYNLNSTSIVLDCSKLTNGTFIVLTRTNKDLYFSKLIVKRN